MKFASNLLRMLLLAWVLFMITPRARAQSVGFSAAPSASSIEVSNSITYTINVTNDSTSAENIWITNIFSGALPAFFNSYNPPSISVTTNANTVVFFVGSLPVNSLIQVGFNAEPMTVGNLTNAITVASFVQTNTLYTTNLVVSVITTNQADLGVTLSGFPAVAYTNDWVTYDLSVTNAGPVNAPNVFLTNTIPTNEAILEYISPSNEVYQTVSSNLILNLGTLAAGTATNLQFTVEPTNSGVFTFSASAGSTTESDPNPANNSFSTDLTVTNFLAGTASLMAFTSSTQYFDHLTGCEEQIITLSNAGPASIVSASRVIVSGLINSSATNWLFNAVGTNNGNPYVLYNAPLATNQSVNLTLQFFPAYTNFLFSSKQLEPVEVEPIDQSLPSTGISSASLNIVLETNISSDFLIEFKTIPNNNYAIAYSDDNGSNWLAAQPPFFVSANYGLWIDYGPPETLINTNTSTMRMYRVYMYP